MKYKLPEPISRDDTEHNKDYYTAETTQKIADAAYTAGLAARVPEGWKLVPIEPPRTRETKLSEKEMAALSEWANRLTVTPEPKP